METKVDDDYLNKKLGNVLLNFSCGPDCGKCKNLPENGDMCDDCHFEIKDVKQ